MPENENRALLYEFSYTRHCFFSCLAIVRGSQICIYLRVRKILSHIEAYFYVPCGVFVVPDLSSLLSGPYPCTLVRSGCAPRACFLFVSPHTFSGCAPGACFSFSAISSSIYIVNRDAFLLFFAMELVLCSVPACYF